MVGNDNLLECDSVFPAVSISVQGQQFSVDLINLPITGADIVLGVQWLKALGPISTDYSSLTMTFLHLAFSGMWPFDATYATRNQQAVLHINVEGKLA